MIGNFVEKVYSSITIDVVGGFLLVSKIAKDVSNASWKAFHYSELEGCTLIQSIYGSLRFFWSYLMLFNFAVTLEN